MTAAQHSLPHLLILAARALWVLAASRWALHRIGPAGVQRRNANATKASHLPAPETMDAQCDAVAFIIPRIARRVPWRADCLVQALAGQHWLRSHGIASEIVVGTARHTDGGFEAHAWLRIGERIILGGDIARFQPLLEPDPTLFDHA